MQADSALSYHCDCSSDDAAQVLLRCSDPSDKLSLLCFALNALLQASTCSDVKAFKTSHSVAERDDGWCVCEIFRALNFPRVIFNPFESNNKKKHRSMLTRDGIYDVGRHPIDGKF